MKVSKVKIAKKTFEQQKKEIMDLIGAFKANNEIVYSMLKLLDDCDTKQTKELGSLNERFEILRQATESKTEKLLWFWVMFLAVMVVDIIIQAIRIMHG